MRGKRGKRLESEGSENKRETEVSRNNISDPNKPSLRLVNKEKVVKK